MNSKVNAFGLKNIRLIEDLKNQFLNTFNSVDKSKNRFEVFQDFVTCFACCLRNSIGKPSKVFFSQTVEDEYFRIMKKYSKEDFQKFPEMLAMIVSLLDAYNAPHDVLGDLYMELNFGSKNNAQFFTPSEISNLMAEICDSKIENIIAEKGFITVADPACGAGSTLLAKVKKLIAKGFNPLYHMYVEGTDIDRLVGLMCYIQLTLWGVPAKIYIGDSLTLKLNEVWVTPAFILGNWQYKLN